MKLTKSILIFLLFAFMLLNAQEKPPFPKGGLEAIMENVEYPKAAKEADVQGKVLIKAVVDKEGNVIKTEVLESVNPDLDNAAVKAVELTKFIPGEKDGKKVKSEVVIPIMFKLK